MCNVYAHNTYYTYVYVLVYNTPTVTGGSQPGTFEMTRNNRRIFLINGCQIHPHPILR